MFPGDRLVSPCYGGRCTQAKPAPDVPYCMNCPKNSSGLSLTYDHCKRFPELVDVELLLEYARNQSAAGNAPLRVSRDIPAIPAMGVPKNKCNLLPPR